MVTQTITVRGIVNMTALAVAQVGRSQSSSTSMNSGNASMPSSAQSLAELLDPRRDAGADGQVDQAPDHGRDTEHERADGGDAGELHQRIAPGRDAHGERSPHAGAHVSGKSPPTSSSIFSLSSAFMPRVHTAAPIAPMTRAQWWVPRCPVPR